MMAVDFLEHSLDPDRLGMREAPADILEPIRELVMVCRDILDENGTLNGSILPHIHAYLRVGSLMLRINTSQCPSCPTFIKSMELDAHGCAIAIPYETRVPSNPKDVTIESIFDLRDILPETFRDATQHILRAEPISKNDWERASEEVYNRAEAQHHATSTGNS